MKKIALVLCLLSSCAFGQTAVTNTDLRSQPYNLRYLARAMGNIGGWWSFLNETEKSAFLDGYQTAMDRSYAQSHGICKIFKDGLKPSSDQEAFMSQMKMAILACESAENFSDFDKVTIRDLDEFYSDPINQPIVLEWSIPYLRDKATARKTNGQLLDALEAEQKDVHDCSKYPNLCKLGIK